MTIDIRGPINHWAQFDIITSGDDYNYQNGWNHFKFFWDAKNPVDGTYHMGLKVNGKLMSPIATDNCTASWVTSALLDYYGIANDYEQTSREINGYMDEFYITDDPHMPEIWTALGKPLWTPRIEK